MYKKKTLQFSITSRKRDAVNTTMIQNIKNIGGDIDKIMHTNKIVWQDNTFDIIPEEKLIDLRAQRRFSGRVSGWFFDLSDSNSIIEQDFRKYVVEKDGNMILGFKIPYLISSKNNIRVPAISISKNFIENFPSAYGVLYINDKSKNFHTEMDDNQNLYILFPTCEYNFELPDPEGGKTDPETNLREFLWGDLHLSKEDNLYLVVYLNANKSKLKYVNNNNIFITVSGINSSYLVDSGNIDEMNNISFQFVNIGSVGVNQLRDLAQSTNYNYMLYTFLRDREYFLSFKKQYIDFAKQFYEEVKREGFTPRDLKLYVDRINLAFKAYNDCNAKTGHQVPDVEYLK